MVKQLIVTAGFSGYTRPYRAALGTEQYDYTCLNTAREVEGVDWDTVAAVVFSGGADIDPAFYGQTAQAQTYTNPPHDALDRAVLDAVRYKPIKKFGTCRGAQLLWAEEGGVLDQHIPHHGRDHAATVLVSRPPVSALTELIQELPPYSRRTQRWPKQEEIDARQVEIDERPVPAMDFEITSLHHQACAWDSWESRRDTPPPVLMMVGESQGQTAVEAWALPQHGVYGFQYHPEWMSAETPGYKWTVGAIQAAMSHEVRSEYLYPQLHTSRSDLR